MKGIITEIVIPKLLKRSNDERILVHKTIRTHGMGESFLAEVIKIGKINYPMMILNWLLAISRHC